MSPSSRMRLERSSASTSSEPLPAYIFQRLSMRILFAFENPLPSAEAEQLRLEFRTELERLGHTHKS